MIWICIVAISPSPTEPHKHAKRHFDLFLTALKQKQSQLVSSQRDRRKTDTLPTRSSFDRASICFIATLVKSMLRRSGDKKIGKN